MDCRATLAMTGGRTRAFLLLLAYLVAIILPLQDSYARNLYAIDGILISSTGKNATEARKTAIDNGEKIAFAKLIQKLAPGTQPEAIGKLIDQSLNPSVQGFEVTNERISSLAYQATLSVTFNPSVVKSALTKAHINFTEISTLHTLLLPLYSDDKGLSLWEPNAWEDAVTKALHNVPNAHYVLPVGDSDDVQLDKNSLNKPDNPALTAMMDKYMAGNVMVMQAAYDPSIGQLHITETLLAPGHPAKTAGKDYDVEKGQTLQALMDQVAAELIAPSKQQVSLLPPSPPKASEINASVPYSDLKDWVSIRTIVSKLPMVQKVTVTLITINEAQFSISYTGEVGALMAALAKQSIHADVIDNTIVMTLIKKP